MRDSNHKLYNLECSRDRLLQTAVQELFPRLAEFKGHIQIYGGPATGKSTLAKNLFKQQKQHSIIEGSGIIRKYKGALCDAEQAAIDTHLASGGLHPDAQILSWHASEMRELQSRSDFAGGIHVGIPRTEVQARHLQKQGFRFANCAFLQVEEKTAKLREYNRAVNDLLTKGVLREEYKEFELRQAKFLAQEPLVRPILEEISACHFDLSTATPLSVTAFNYFVYLSRKVEDEQILSTRNALLVLDNEIEAFRAKTLKLDSLFYFTCFQVRKKVDELEEEIEEIKRN